MTSINYKRKKLHLSAVYQHKTWILFSVELDVFVRGSSLVDAFRKMKQKLGIDNLHEICEHWCFKKHIGYGNSRPILKVWDIDIGEYVRY